MSYVHNNHVLYEVNIGTDALLINRSMCASRHVVKTAAAVFPERDSPSVQKADQS